MNIDDSRMSDEQANAMSRARWSGLEAVRQGDEYLVGAPVAGIGQSEAKGRSKVSWEDAFADADRIERRTKTKKGH